MRALSLAPLSLVVVIVVVAHFQPHSIGWGPTLSSAGLKNLGPRDAAARIILWGHFLGPAREPLRATGLKRALACSFGQSGSPSTSFSRRPPTPAAARAGKPEHMGSWWRLILVVINSSRATLATLPEGRAQNPREISCRSADDCAPQRRVANGATLRRPDDGWPRHKGSSHLQVATLGKRPERLK